MSYFMPALNALWGAILIAICLTIAEIIMLGIMHLIAAAWRKAFQ